MRLRRDQDKTKLTLRYIFCLISSMEARIFMKFETYVHKIVLDHQPNFHKDACKDARAQDENAHTCDALQRKCVFRPFYSLFLIRPKYYESSKTEYSDSTSFINRLTPLIFFLVF